MSNISPVWRYCALENGAIESRLFDDIAKVPKGEGWQDSPAKCVSSPAQTSETKSDDMPAKPASRRKRSAP